MLNRKILILAFVFIILLCISPVNASNNNTDNMQEIDDELISMELDSVDEISANDEIPGTFSELSDIIQNKKTGETVYLNKSYQFNVESDVNYSSGIKLKSVIIEGNNQVIDGNGQSGIFRIVDENVTLNNLRIINSLSEKDSAIYCKGNLTCNNVTFENNYANGAAMIYAGVPYDGFGTGYYKLIINNCIFRDSMSFKMLLFMLAIYILLFRLTIVFLKIYLPKNQHYSVLMLI